jgi:hypothetical protein
MCRALVLALGSGTEIGRPAERSNLDGNPKNVLERLWRWALILLWSLRGILRTVWGLVRAPLIAALQVIAALIVLFEEWGWKPLSDLLARLARFAPIALIERWIAGLPPYAALLIFALPTTLLLPLKFVAMWLLANGKVWTATGLFAGAKVASTALIARIFTLTKPSLMQIGWFARAYNWFVPWKDALFAQIRASWVWRYGRMVKNRVRLEAKQAWARWQPVLHPWIAAIRYQLRARLAGVRNLARQAMVRLRGLFGHG